MKTFILCNLISSCLFIFLFIPACVEQGQSFSRNGKLIESKEVVNPKSYNGNASYQPSDGVKCGLLDEDGILWFGTNNEGVYRYDGKSFTNFSESDGLCNNNVSSILEDKEGGLWFGTINGLCKYDKENFVFVPIPFSDTSSIWLDKVYPVINPNEVHSLNQDREGNIWIGTVGGGAYKYEPASGAFTSFLSDVGRKQSDGLYHNWIPSITNDVEGNVWFASMTHGGASRYDFSSGTFTHFMPEDGLSDDMVRTIFVDRSGDVWFGFNGNRGSGLTRYDGQTFFSYHKKDGLCNTNIRAIYEDGTGNIWLGSGRNGICIYDGEKFSEFKTADGESFESILFILEDAEGSIWFGGSSGKLFCYDGITLTDFTNKGR